MTLFRFMFGKIFIFLLNYGERLLLNVKQSIPIQFKTACIDFIGSHHSTLLLQHVFSLWEWRTSLYLMKTSSQVSEIIFTMQD